MIAVKVNGQPCEVGLGSSLQEVLQVLGYDPVIIAVAVNGVVVTKQNYAQHQINSNDMIEIVAPMVGG
jgi:thiamine biosynthesis protein ThiS